MDISLAPRAPISTKYVGVGNGGSGSAQERQTHVYCKEMLSFSRSNNPHVVCRFETRLIAIYRQKNLPAKMDGRWRLDKWRNACGNNELD